MEKQQEKQQNCRRSSTRKGVYVIQALLGWVMSCVAALLLIYILFGICFTPLRISGSSMEPSLRAGEVVLVDRLAKYTTLPHRGDVVLFEDPLGSGLLVRRIVALPGEEVMVADGRLYLSGCPVEESVYAGFEDATPEELGPLVVPEGMVYVLGDHRADVYDSRCEGIGCVAYNNILGTVRLRIYPFGRVNLYY